MSLLLLPRLGAGNHVAFDNNFAVVKDGAPWQNGGTNTFDASSGVQVSSPNSISPNSNGWTTIGEGSYIAPDGVMTPTHALVGNVLDLGVYSGWAAAGLYACEIELGYDAPNAPLNLRFGCNTGYDNGSPTGIVLTTFELGPNSYELKTVWTTYGPQDSWESTGKTQLTVTVVPYLASQNGVGANPFYWSGQGDDRQYRLDQVQRGATMYIQWGRVNVDAVQRWIIGDLVESDEFANAPHDRTAVHHSPPAAHRMDMLRWNSPTSAQWETASGDVLYRALGAHRKNVYFGGHGVIAGTVKAAAKGAGQSSQPSMQPLVRRVQLWSEKSSVLVAQTWSDAAGNYSFSSLDPAQRYTVISFDHEHLYRAVIADNLQPQILP